METDFKLALIVNGRSKKGLRLLDELPELAAKIQVFRTEYSRHATELASIAIESGFQLIIAMGGDGTLSEVIQAFGMAHHNGLKLPLFSFIPCGSANDFARNFKSNFSIRELIQKAKDGQFQSVDLGQLKIVKKNRYFLNIADYGFGADVARRVNESPSRFGSAVTFLDAATRAFMRAKKFSIELKIDDLIWSGNALAVIFANGRSFGSGLIISPFAHVSSSYLNVIIIGEVSMLDYARNLPRVKLGKTIKHPGVHYFKAKSVELLSSPPPIMEADGEFVGNQVYGVSLIPSAIRLVV